MYEWDENKHLSNLDKHKLDFVDARLFFDGRKTITATAHTSDETRYLTTVQIQAKFYTLVWTWRGNVRRIISFRRSRDGEERAYRQIHG